MIHGHLYKQSIRATDKSDMTLASIINMKYHPQTDPYESISDLDILQNFKKSTFQNLSSVNISASSRTLQKFRLEILLNSTVRIRPVGIDRSD